MLEVSQILMPNKKRRLSNIIGDGPNELATHNGSQSTKNYAPPYLHPGRRRKRFLSMSEGFNSLPHRDPRIGSGVPLSSPEKFASTITDDRNVYDDLTIRDTHEKEGSNHMNKTLELGIAPLKHSSSLNLTMFRSKEASNSQNTAINYCHTSPILVNREEEASNQKPTLYENPRVTSSQPVHEIELDEQNHKNDLSKLVKEVMRYEIRIAGLYGRMAEIRKENSGLRNDLKILAEKNAELTLSSRETTNIEANTYPVYDNMNLRTKSSSKSNKPNNDINEEDLETISISLRNKKQKDVKLPELLKNLQKRILKRLEEYAIAQKHLESSFRVFNENENSQERLLQEESPFVKDLRFKLIRMQENLNRIKESGNIRIANLRASLCLQKTNEMSLHKKLGQSQNYVSDSTKYVKEAVQHIEMYKTTIAKQKKLISDLQQEISKIKAENAHSGPQNVDKACGIKGDAYMDYESVIKVIEMQRKDIGILNDQLHEEKLKSKSLSSALEKQNNKKTDVLIRKGGNHNGGQEELANLSKNYQKILKQQAADKKYYHNRIQEIHKMYREMLHKKDIEHREHLKKLTNKFPDRPDYNCKEAHSEPLPSDDHMPG